MRSSPWAAALVSLLLVGPSGGQADDEPAVVTVAVGKQVEIEYTLRLDDGSTADSNVGGAVGSPRGAASRSRGADA